MAQLFGWKKKAYKTLVTWFNSETNKQKTRSKMRDYCNFHRNYGGEYRMLAGIRSNWIAKTLYHYCSRSYSLSFHKSPPIPIDRIETIDACVYGIFAYDMNAKSISFGDVQQVISNQHLNLFKHEWVNRWIEYTKSTPAIWIWTNRFQST